MDIPRTCCKASTRRFLSLCKASSGGYHLAFSRSASAMRLATVLCFGLVGVPASAAADSCPQPSSEIATDRPDVTNSSLVVPQGSFQQENGVNISRRDGGAVWDGT